MADDDLLDLDEDLFDFDELLRDMEQMNSGPELAAAPIEVESETSGHAPAAPLPRPAQPAIEPVAQAAAHPISPPVTHQPQRKPPPVAPRPVAGAPAATTVPTPEAQPAPARRFALTRGTAAMVGALSLLQIVVLFLVVQAVTAVRGMVREVESRATPASSETTSASLDAAPLAVQDAAPVETPPSEGELALERAQELLLRGDHERARETLYSLLAVIDRLPANLRRDVEARARFLVADSWRLEAEVSRDLAALRPADTGEEPQR